MSNKECTLHIVEYIESGHTVADDDTPSESYHVRGCRTCGMRYRFYLEDGSESDVYYVDVGWTQERLI